VYFQRDYIIARFARAVKALILGNIQQIAVRQSVFYCAILRGVVIM